MGESYGLSRYGFRSGCFAEDARGHWFLCICVKAAVRTPAGQDRIGIDLGLTTTATCLDGTRLSGTPYRNLEPALAVAQRARKKKRVRAIHARIRHRRADALHKFSTSLVARCGKIHVGDVSGAKLARTKMAKSVHDAGWSSLRTMLETSPPATARRRSAGS